MIMVAHKLFFANVAVILTALCCCAFEALAASIVGSKHDISTGTNNEPCAFCHTPHFASAEIAAPLWNRKIANLQSAVFTMYASPTLDTSLPVSPGALSLACLSCHDGVSADVHATGVINAPGSGLGAGYGGSCARCHPHGTISQLLKLGPNLSNDHPISMTYPTPQQDPAFFMPPDLQKGWSDMPLYGGKVECPSCHNVHDPAKTPFLRIANTGSALCYKCHNK